MFTFAKHSQKTLDTGGLHGGKYLCGVKKGGRAFARRGRIFGNLLTTKKAPSNSVPKWPRYVDYVHPKILDNQLQWNPA